MGDKLLRRRQVEEITGMRRSSIYRLMQTGDFPPPVRVGPAAVRWRESDITGWMESLPIAEPVRPAQRSQSGPPKADLGGQEVRPLLHQRAAPLKEIGPGVRLFGRSCPGDGQAPPLRRPRGCPSAPASSS